MNLIKNLFAKKTVEMTDAPQAPTEPPTSAAYPGSSQHPWNIIPLGIGADGKEVIVDLTATPHTFLVGSVGSGKSVIQRNLFFHCVQHNDRWRFIGIDVKRVELAPFRKYEETVLGIASNLEDGVEMLRYATEVMEKRYEELEAAGINNFKDLINPETGRPDYAVMLMVDEAFMFLAPEGGKTDEGIKRDELQHEATSLLAKLARLGRAAGIFLVVATQRPDASVFSSEFRANFDIRIAAGRLDETPSLMTLNSDAATRLPGRIIGRGIAQFQGRSHEFQGYFAPQSWIDEWLQEHPDVEPNA